MTTPTIMNSTQLAIILKKDKYTLAVFQGVYPSDKLPTKVSSFPALFIANVDTSDKPGSHWVAFYSQKIKKENLSTLMDYPQAIMLEHFLRF